MAKRRLLTVCVSLVGLAAAASCTSLTYDCAGICGTEVGNGDFEGVVSANSVSEAIAACEKMSGCDAGYTATCSCYLQQGANP
jgi:hypothetical protein